MLSFHSMTKSIKLHHERFIDLLKKVGFDNKSQAEIAEAFRLRTGEPIHQTMISGLMAGKKQPSIEMFGQWVLFLETNADYLLGLTDNPDPASDQEDQVVATARSEQEKVVLQEILELLRGKPIEEQKFVLDLVKRLVASQQPRIIGGRG